MKQRKTVAAVAMTGALAGGALFGAVLGNPLASGAQDADTEATTPAPDAEAPARGPEGRRGPGLEAAAEVLNLDVDELHTQLHDGQTLAQIAEAQGVDVQTVIDALVADATDHINQEVADGELTQEEADQRLENLTERITTMVNEGRPEGEGPGGRGPGGPGHHGPKLDAAAEALGLSADELRDQLGPDTTLADVAAAQGVDVQTVIDAMVADAQEHLATAVEEGRLTQEEADAKAADLVERITSLVNDGPPERGERPADAPEGN